MIVGVKDIYLYTGLTPTGGNDSAQALQWLNDNNIPHINLWYGDPAQHQDVFDSLNSWGVGEFNDFPFVVYDELHDDYTTQRRALIGLDEIVNSNLVELVTLTNLQN